MELEVEPASELRQSQQRGGRVARKNGELGVVGVIAWKHTNRVNITKKMTKLDFKGFVYNAVSGWLH